MALPSVVSTLVDPYHGVGGPFVSSTGSVYIVTRSNAGVDIHIFKAADPGGSWAAAASDLAVTSGNAIRHIAATQVSDTIHIVTRDAAAANSCVIRYHAFNMATDAYTTSNELVKTTYTMAGPVDVSLIGIAIRSNGDKIVFYEGPQVLADIQRSRCYYARHMGSAWSADIAIGGTGNAHWYPQEIIAAGNRVHFFMLDNTNEDLYQQTLNSANALETLPSAFDSVTNNQSDLGQQRGCAYSGSAGGTVVRYPYYNSFTPDINDVRFTSADAPSPLTISTDITNPFVVAGGTLRRHVNIVADGAVTYSVFNDNASGLYVASSDDAAAWATPTLALGTTAAYVYANRYVRNSNVIGIVYLEGASNLSYYEYTLSTAAATGQTTFGMLMGVGR